jgi:hypothetical protein
MKVTVLGCGPAGLVAAQGAADAGAEVAIVSNKVQSFIAGAQFIHAPIPGIKARPERVMIAKRGSEENYAKKVYGDPERRTSWGAYEHGDELAAWSMREVYGELWARWEDSIIGTVLTPVSISEIEESDELVISTIPAHALCQADGQHTFEGQEVAITVAPCKTTHSSIIYNGDMRQRWSRASYLFGDLSIEYGLESFKHAAKAVPHNAKRIIKPQWTDCSCRSGIMRVGRYGRWQRGVFVHEVYEEVFTRVQSSAMQRVS